MSFNEETLRQLLESPYGPTCAKAFLEAVATGKTLEIKKTQGEVVRLTDRMQAERALQQFFGWQPEP